MNRVVFPRSILSYLNHSRLDLPLRLPKHFANCGIKFASTGASNTKVTILGAGGDLGKSVALLLKQSLFIDELCLYHNLPLEPFACDLNYIDTKCKVTTYCGIDKISKALSNAMVVAIFASCPHSDRFSYSGLFEKNAPAVKEYATNIAQYASKSFVAIGAEPINSMVPMFSEILKKQGTYNPNAIFGITTIDVVRANKFVAEVLGLDPECVIVPVVGGHTEKTMVPILSQAQPCNEFTNEELEDITNSVRKADDNLLKIHSGPIYLSKAFAAARFIMSLIKALRGQPGITECAYVKSNVSPQLKYMVTPLQLGQNGLAKNLGLPDMTDYEFCLLENAIPLLVEDIKKGEFFGGRPMEIVDGILQDKPLCDPCRPRCPPNHCELQSLFANKS